MEGNGGSQGVTVIFLSRLYGVEGQVINVFTVEGFLSRLYGVEVVKQFK